MKKDILIIASLAIVFITLPLFLERLHSDEVIFWEVARNIAEGRGMVSETTGGPFYLHPPVPFFINGLFLKFNPHIFVARLVSSLFTAGSALLVYLSARRISDRGSALSGALLFIFSFHALRFGSRFYLDQYGAFFFLLSLYLHMRGMPALSSLTILLAALCREYWAVALPFFIALSIVNTKRKAALTSAVAIVVLIAVSALVYLRENGAGGRLEGFMSAMAASKNLSASVGGLLTKGYAVSLLRGWAEFVAVNPLLTAGFATWLLSAGAHGSRMYPALAFLLVPAISLTHGFILDGGVTQYPFSLVALLAPFSGAGLRNICHKALGILTGCGKTQPDRQSMDGLPNCDITKSSNLRDLAESHSAKSWRKKPWMDFFRILLRRTPVGNERGLASLSIGAVIAQFIFFNAYSTLVTQHKNIGIYALGYWDDRKVIEMLQERAGGSFIHGIHGAFVAGRKRWDWTDYMLNEAIDKGPDWLITYDNLVEILPEERWKGDVEIYRIGPYLVAHPLSTGALRLALAPKGFWKWRLRKGQPHLNPLSSGA